MDATVLIYKAYEITETVKQAARDTFNKNYGKAPSAPILVEESDGSFYEVGVMIFHSHRIAIIGL